MAEQDLGKSVTVGEAEKARKFFKPVAVARQHVGLFVGDHLQPVLDRAQESVGRGQLVARFRVDPAALGESGKRRQRLALAQLRVPSAGDELLSLDEEFDLANAAAAELDIMSLDRNLAVAAIGVDL